VRDGLANQSESGADVERLMLEMLGTASQNSYCNGGRRVGLITVSFPGESALAAEQAGRVGASRQGT